MADKDNEIAQLKKRITELELERDSLLRRLQYKSDESEDEDLDDIDENAGYVPVVRDFDERVFWCQLYPAGLIRAPGVGFVPYNEETLSLYGFSKLRK